jgi:CoA:oxalate CoA-transferase
MGAMLALYHREREGKGKYVDISMLDGMISMLGYTFSDVMLMGTKLRRNGNRDDRAFTNTFPTKDGYIFIAPVTPKMWEEFCKIMGRYDWLNSESPFSDHEGRLKHRDELEHMISRWTILFEKDEIFQLLQKVGIACGPVNTLDDIINDPQVKQREMVKKMNAGKYGDEVFVTGIPIKINDTRQPEFTPPPAVGEHSEEILEELGYLKRDIKLLRENGVIV